MCYDARELPYVGWSWKKSIWIAIFCCFSICEGTLDSTPIYHVIYCM